MLACANFSRQVSEVSTVNNKLVLPLALAGAALAAVALTGCSSSSSSDASTPAPPAPASSAPAASQEPSADPSSSLVGGDPSTWSPLVLDATTQSATLVVGQAGVFNSLPEGANVTIVTSDPAILSVSQAGEGSNAGIQAVAPGSATLTIEDGFAADQGATVLVTIPVTVVATAAELPADMGQVTGALDSDTGMSPDSDTGIGSDMDSEAPVVTDPAASPAAS